MSKKKLVGDDKVGRLIRLNKQVLAPGKKGYASIVFFGDVHVGHPQCDMERATAMLDYCVKNHIYVLGMGDWMECGLRMSIGDSVYKQQLNPQDQMEEAIEMLEPVAKAGLLLGIHEGNHEQRITKETGIDPTRIIAKTLGVPYLGYAIWNLFRVGTQNYTAYTWHGASGSRFRHTKLKAVLDASQQFEADIIAMGHVHDKEVSTVLRQRVNIRNRTVEERKVHVFLTGSYIKYDKSYAQAKGYPPSPLGSPKVQLYGSRWDIHSSL